MNIAIVTGASSGIGREFVREIAKDGSLSEIWIVARRKDKLLELKKEFGSRILPVAIDITTPEAIEKIEQLFVSHSSPVVKYLINSAGYGKLGAFKDTDVADSAGMVELNCTALTRLTGIVLPHMEKGSIIINIASAAAFMPQPKFAVYAATKSYVLSFSRALRAELKKQKIKVTAVCPGPVKTEFFDIAEKGGQTLAIKKLFMADATNVARKSLKAGRRNKAVYTHKVSMKLFRLATKVLPKRLLMKFVR